jgi:hypothetical protein
LLNCRTCSIGVCANVIGRPRRLRQDLRRLRYRSYITGEIDLAAVQGGGVGERARAEPADVVHRNHL